MATGLRSAASALRVSRQTLQVKKQIIKANQQSLGIESRRSAAIARNQVALQKEAQLLGLSAQERKNELETINRLLQSSQNLSAEEERSLKAQRDAIEKVNDLNDKQINQLAEQNRLVQEKIELYKKAIAAQKEALGSLKGDVVSLGKELTNLQIGSSAGFDKTFGNLDKLATNFTGIGDLMKNVVGSFTEGQGVLGGVLGGINTVVNKSASLALAETMKIRTEIDSNRAALARFTGSAFELRGEMNALKTSSEGLYLNYTESKEIITSLYAGMYEFRDATAAQRVEFSKSTILYKRMGLNLGNVSKAFDFMIKVLGKTAGEATKTYNEIFGLAKALKIPPNIIQQQYAQAQDRLTIFGDASTRIFRDVAAVSSATGVEISDLFNAMKKFDTFEGAAKSAAKLNAYLRGPYLDTQKLLTMSDEERMLYIKEQIKSSGIDLENSNKMLKIGLAREAGFKNVTDFMKFMRTDQEKINDAMKESATISNKQETAMKGMRAAAKESLTQDERLARSINNAFGSDRGARRLLGLQKQIIGQFDKMSGAVENYEKRMQQFSKIKALTWAASMLFNMKGLSETTDDSVIPGFLKLAGVLTAIGVGMFIFKDGIGEAENNAKGLITSVAKSLKDLVDSGKKSFIEVKFSVLKFTKIATTIFNKIYDAVVGSFILITTKIKDIIGDMKSFIERIFGIIMDNPYVSAASSFFGGAKDTAGSTIDGVFDIASLVVGDISSSIGEGVSNTFGLGELDEQKQKELIAHQSEINRSEAFAARFKNLSAAMSADPANKAAYEEQIKQLMKEQRIREGSSLFRDTLASTVQGVDISTSLDPALRGTTLGITENISSMAGESGESIKKFFTEMQGREDILGEAATNLGEVVTGFKEALEGNKEMQAILKIGDIDFKMFVQNLLDAVLAGK